MSIGPEIRWICRGEMMSDVEFRRELSPDQLNEALSLLDGGAGVSVKDPQAQDARVAEETGPGAGELRAPVAAQDRLLGAEGPQQRLTRAGIAVYGVAIAATLALLAWGGPRLVHPAPGLGPAGSRPVASSIPDRNGESAAGPDAPGSPDAIPPPPQAAAASASAEGRGGQSEYRKRSARQARTAKQRSWRRQPQARADLGYGPCPYSGCLSQPRPAFYDPPRGENQ